MPVLHQHEMAVKTSADNAVLVGGFPVFVGSDEELLSAIEVLVAANERSLIVTANVDQVLDLGRNEELFAAYQTAAIRTLDGMPLVWMAKWAGASPVHRQTGADLLIKCARTSEMKKWRIVILGGEDRANELAVRKLGLDYPAADIVGIQLPYYTAHDQLSDELTQLRQISPDVVFVCLGSPKQERLFMELRNQLPPAVYVGAGAAVDFASGFKLRAPKLIQTAGLEWLWRLILEPRRLAYRYLIKGAAVGRIGYNTVRKRHH